MIMHLRPNVINVLAKTWFTKTNIQQKMFDFYLNFSFIYINIFANTYMKNNKFNLFYQYMLLFTNIKQFSNLLKINKK